MPVSVKRFTFQNGLLMLWPVNWIVIHFRPNQVMSADSAVTSPNIADFWNNIFEACTRSPSKNSNVVFVNSRLLLRWALTGICRATPKNVGHWPPANVRCVANPLLMPLNWCRIWEIFTEPSIKLINVNLVTTEAPLIQHWKPICVLCTKIFVNIIAIIANLPVLPVRLLKDIFWLFMRRGNHLNAIR